MLKGLSNNFSIFCKVVVQRFANDVSKLFQRGSHKIVFKYVPNAFPNFVQEVFQRCSSGCSTVLRCFKSVPHVVRWVPKVSFKGISKVVQLFKGLFKGSTNNFQRFNKGPLKGLRKVCSNV